ncbi:MAG: NAD(+) synthase [Parcubacteria group bacterium]|nr:NAD(+) synthase [Parcubacteria group bacterium]
MEEDNKGSVASYYPGKPKKTGPLDFAFKKKMDEEMVKKMCAFLRESITAPDYWGGAVVGLSDGLDGATVTALAREALGKENVTAIIVNLGSIPEHHEQTELALKSALALGVTYEVFDASKIYGEFQALTKEHGPFTDVNISTRVVQNILFQVADEKNYAVLSTINKSEILTGRLMEHFYGHVAPLMGLFKSEIFDLARILGVPEEIIARKPGGVDTWYDEDTFGVTYDTLDKMLYLLTEKNVTPEAVAKQYDFDQEWIERLKERTTQRLWRLTTKELHL